MERIWRTILTDVDDTKDAPPARVLTVGRVGEIVYLTIGKYDEDGDGFAFNAEGKGEFAVDLETLMHAVGIRRGVA